MNHNPNYHPLTISEIQQLLDEAEQAKITFGRSAKSSEDQRIFTKIINDIHCRFDRGIVDSTQHDRLLNMLGVLYVNWIKDKSQKPVAARIKAIMDGDV